MKEKLLENIAKICTLSKHKISQKSVYNDLIQLTFNAVITQDFLDDNFKASTVWYDERLRLELGTYRDEPRCWGLLNACHAQWLYLVMQADPFEDVMGTLYSSYVGEKLAQFLTPRSVAMGLARMTIANDKLEPGVPIKIADPSGCGGGAMLLAALTVLKERNGVQSLLDLEVFGMDLDPHMVRLTVCQIMLAAALHGMPIGSLKIFWGDAIKDYLGQGKLAFSFDSRHSSVFVKNYIEQRVRETAAA